LLDGPFLFCDRYRLEVDRFFCFRICFHDYAAKTLCTDCPALSEEDAMKSLIAKRSIVIAGHKTSISLEDSFWKDLREIAHARGETLSRLVSSINADRQNANLSSEIRLFVLGFYHDQCSDYQRRMSEQMVWPSPLALRNYLTGH
jgi:predicted DNA-binding ribbon-helix-helix protein